MNDHETRIRALEQARKELEDAFLVMTHLETKQSNVIKQQSQAVDELRQRDETQRKLNEETDHRIAALVSAAAS
jgi:hypothetical protein